MRSSCVEVRLEHKTTDTYLNMGWVATWQRLYLKLDQKNLIHVLVVVVLHDTHIQNYLVMKYAKSSADVGLYSVQLLCRR